jgi:hypothetical protein
MVQNQVVGFHPGVYIAFDGKGYPFPFGVDEFEADAVIESHKQIHSLVTQRVRVYVV